MRVERAAVRMMMGDEKGARAASMTLIDSFGFARRFAFSGGLVSTTYHCCLRYG